MPTTTPPDLSEHGRDADGKPVTLNQRLFMQLLVLRNVMQNTLVDLIKAQNTPAVVYQNANDPYSLGLLLFDTDPDQLIHRQQTLLHAPDLTSCTLDNAMTMLGRTYSIGYEANLEHVLLKRPIERVCNPDTPWAIWYPLRRTGAFAQLSPEAQRTVLMEHGNLGHSFGDAGLATDIRLAAHGLNQEDQDFVIGLIGKEAFPLSALIQAMRPTVQTSQYIQTMGPFFVGRAIYQSEAAS